MAKFIKSLFTPEKRKNSKIDGEGEGDRDDFTPPLDGRRKLSISRSGRMKQANKKRHELNMELYGDEHHQEKPKTMEYHVNKNKNVSSDPTRGSIPHTESSRSSTEGRGDTKKESISVEVKTPEEEIESAFEIIDKVS